MPRNPTEDEATRTTTYDCGSTKARTTAAGAGECEDVCVNEAVRCTADGALGGPPPGWPDAAR